MFIVFIKLLYAGLRVTARKTTCRKKGAFTLACLLIDCNRRGFSCQLLYFLFSNFCVFFSPLSKNFPNAGARGVFRKRENSLVCLFSGRRTQYLCIVPKYNFTYFITRVYRCQLFLLYFPQYFLFFCTPFDVSPCTSQAFSAKILLAALTECRAHILDGAKFSISC